MRALQGLAVGLFLRQIANDGQLETLAVESLNQCQNPDEEERQPHQRPDEKAHQPHKRQVAKEGERHVDHNAADGQEDALPCVKSNERASVIGFYDQKNDRRNNGDIREPAGCIVGKSGLAYGGRGLLVHEISLDVRCVVNPDAASFPAQGNHSGSSGRAVDTSGIVGLADYPGNHCQCLVWACGRTVEPRSLWRARDSRTSANRHKETVKLAWMSRDFWIPGVSHVGTIPPVTTQRCPAALLCYPGDRAR